MPQTNDSKRKKDIFSKLSESIESEQVRMAYRNMRVSSFAVIFNTAVMGWILWDISDKAIVASWVLAQAIVMFWRLFYWRQFRLDSSVRSTREWKNLFLTGMILSAVVWGLASIVLFPGGHPTHESFFIIMLAGLSAGGVSSLSSVRFAAQAYSSILVIPLVIAVMIQSQPLYFLLGVVILFYWALIISVATRINENIATALRNSFLHENALAELQLNKEHFETIFKEAPAGIFYYDNDLIVLDSNNEMLRILNIGREKMLGLDMKILPDDRLSETLMAPLKNKKGYYEGPYKTMFNKLDLWITLQTTPLYDADRNVIGGVGIVSDITDRMIAEEKMKRQAYFDTLTDIPNRALLKDRIDQALAQFRRHRSYLAVMFLDLDHFKSVNDSLGHHAGDALLIETAKRLVNICREDDTVARLGGDEFVILLKDLGPDPLVAASKAETVAEKIHYVLSYPYELGESEPIGMSSSIGIALVGDLEQSSEDLLKYADTAMYHAKKEGRNTTRFYQDQMDQWIKKRLFMENALRNAIKNHELELYYQPVTEVKNRRIIGAEALLRWNHPEMGMVMPDEIISIAEESKLIVPIGEWVLEEACRQFVEWKTTHSKGPELNRIAVNVSAIQFRQHDFVDNVIRIVSESGIRPNMIEIELTESIIIDKIETVIEKIERLNEFGISVSMDDFGTGYSSLAYLKRLPFSTLKIDRSFVRDVMTDSDDAALVETIISMASIFRLNVIAEGVETMEQLEFLDRLGCQYFQGYLCSRPLPAKSYSDLLNLSVTRCS